MAALRDCCRPAAEELNKLGITTAENGKRIAKWNRDFRQNNQFPHPNAWVRIGKKPKPPIFELFAHLEQRCMHMF